MYLKKIYQQFKFRKESIKHLSTDTKNLAQTFPVDFTETEKDLIASVKDFTMTSSERIVSLIRAIDYLETNKIDGDVVECGVWKGGSMMAVAKRLIERNNQTRKLYLFDTFNGMSKPTDDDSDYNNRKATDIYSDESKRYEHEDWCYSSLNEVKKNMLSTNYDGNNVFFIPGRVEETLPFNAIHKVAVLRLDTDFYESTKHELIHLYHKIVPGGILIIDDYGHWRGAKKAVDEFIALNSLSLFLQRVDYTCRMAVKPL